MPFKMIVLRPDGTREEATSDVEPPLEVLQAAVAGNLEALPPWQSGVRPPQAYVNELGKYLGLPRNDFAATVLGWPQHLDPLVGNVVVLIHGDA